MIKTYSSESGGLFVNGAPATDDEWTEWQQARVAAYNARQAHEDRVSGYDRRIGGGISGDRSSRRGFDSEFGISERALDDRAAVRRALAAHVQ